RGGEPLHQGLVAEELLTRREERLSLRGAHGGAVRDQAEVRPVDLLGHHPRGAAKRAIGGLVVAEPGIEAIGDLLVADEGPSHLCEATTRPRNDRYAVSSPPWGLSTRLKRPAKPLRTVQ